MEKKLILNAQKRKKRQKKQRKKQKSRKLWKNQIREKTKTPEESKKSSN